MCLGDRIRTGGPGTNVLPQRLCPEAGDDAPLPVHAEGPYLLPYWEPVATKSERTWESGSEPDPLPASA